MDFTPFPKLSRLSRDAVITEKLDGTNAHIFITPGYAKDPNVLCAWYDADTSTDMVMYAGSRTRWITPDNDNYGFAAWALTNNECLRELGAGHHFGEWWGAGIQRRYGLAVKRFSLFNSARWTEERPECCGVVPVLYSGVFTTDAVSQAIDYLVRNGSVAAPGFMDPEGVVVYHTAAGISFKKTCKKDESPKGTHQ